MQARKSESLRRKLSLRNLLRLSYLLHILEKFAAPSRPTQQNTFSRNSQRFLTKSKPFFKPIKLDSMKISQDNFSAAPIFSISAAAFTIPSPSKVRSSSRRFPTSTRKVILELERTFEG